MDFLALSTLLPEITLSVMAMLLLIAGAFSGPRSAGAVLNCSVILLLIVAAMVAFTGAQLLPQAADETSLTLFSPGKFTDSTIYTAVFKVLVLVSAAIALVMSSGYIGREDMKQIEFPVLVLLACVGMMLMISAHNMLMLYVGLELQSLALYVLAAFRRDSTRSTEAGLKYFVLGALASGLLLYGISLIYGFAGTLDFAQIASTVKVTTDTQLPLVVGLVFILVALAFKVSAAPFHMWTPDVYEGAPTPVTAFFSAVPKLAAMALLIKVLSVPFAGAADVWKPMIAVFSLVSMLVGSFAAIGQTSIKRLLAYSSIGHVGFALMALAAGEPATVMLYMAFYVVMSFGAFSVVLLMRRDSRMLEEIEDLSGISRVHPGLAAAMAILMFSMAGIPPMVGFFTKLYVFMAAVHAGLIWLAVAGAVSSVVGAYYYLRVIKVMYFDDPVFAFDARRELVLGGTLTVMTALTVGGLVLLSPVYLVAQMAVKSLLP